MYIYEERKEDKRRKNRKNQDKTEKQLNKPSNE
jgi:hypothetical protein